MRRIGKEMAEECEAAGVDTMLDLIMHRALALPAAITNYRLPDITGYAAKFEVRSPFLDYRLVEFAARLTMHTKCAAATAYFRPKYLPRKVYESLIRS